ncbi:uncharacterized protein STEHIDRAFT_150375 [Stereum hirsutum FP-91666 SS1]|uniref:uncharacterized protein n=1 Tax=Stereum hirsutum (strain FP-91666) TaxID=721885 RepID=UPI0004449B8E|nr:uncharacterized protein STEHIDRAFT_150375 [Stereum hirsutum FP-91666 SS1]EIM80649.1 hypothetical protein STEHIDRAFT_150375 [Stereum hirsutum FP-91666 SS1]
MRPSPTSVRLPQAGRRWASSSVGASSAETVIAVERMKRKVRRVRKAEKDERIDISTHLTEVKTYMGGFTRPRDLRASNWFPGGRYRAIGKEYDNPSPKAYEPHTVFVAESRYPISFARGRADTHEYIVAVTRESELPDVLRKLNSPSAHKLDPKATQCMDNARWPWLPAKKERPVQWWKDGENPEKILERLANGEDADYDVKEINLDASIPVHSTSSSTSASPAQARGFHTSARDGPRVFLLSPRSIHSSASKYSNPRPKPKTSDDHAREGTVPEYYVERKKQRDAIQERKELEGSLMYELGAGILSDDIAASTRRPANKIPTEFEAEDGTIIHPSGFTVPSPGEAPVSYADTRERDPSIETANVAERVGEEDYTGVRAHVRPHSQKIPFEVEEPDGTVRHPSGFEPPTPAHEFPAALIGKVKDAVLVEVDPDSVVPEFFVARKLQRQLVRDGKPDRELAHAEPLELSGMNRPAHKIPFEHLDIDGNLIHPSGFMVPSPAPHVIPRAELRQRDPLVETQGVADRVTEEAVLAESVKEGFLRAQTRALEGKVPFEVVLPDGTVTHPSGFIPPTPAAAFNKNGTSTFYKRGFHSSTLVRASEVSMPTSPSAVREEHNFFRQFRRDELGDIEDVQGYLTALRERYQPTLKETPFWRPLITVTMSTRPLAMALNRLCKGISRGAPFVTNVSNEDRKISKSLTERIRNMRIQRMHELVTGMADGLASRKGGFVGIRFSNNELGRGIDAEKLADPIPYDRRVIKVGVGKWFRRSDEVKELFEESAKSYTHPWLETFDLNDAGERLNENGEVVPWPQGEPMKKIMPNEWLPEELALQPGERVFGKQYEEWTPHASQKDLYPTVEVAETQEKLGGEVDGLEFEDDEVELGGEVQLTTYKYRLPPKKAGHRHDERERRLHHLRQQYLAEHHGEEVADVISQYYSRNVFSP